MELQYSNREQVQLNNEIIRQLRIYMYTIKVAYSFNQVMNATVYGAGTCLIMFTMNWQIHQGIYVCLQVKKILRLRNGDDQITVCNTNKNM